MQTFRTKLIKIGNSQGIRIPKIMLEQLSLTDMLELQFHDDHLVIRSCTKPRQHWATSFQAMAANGDDQLLDEEFNLTTWEENEWEW
ncbi:MAG: hypothetical protein KAX40_04035 [Herpetosiphon sp.]|nr:hypothetical protein [Herpetosiphon sp.]